MNFALFESRARDVASRPQPTTVKKQLRVFKRIDIILQQSCAGNEGECPAHGMTHEITYEITLTTASSSCGCCTRWNPATAAAYEAAVAAAPPDVAAQD
jgi:hypothetical protein